MQTKFAFWLEIVFFSFITIAAVSSSEYEIAGLTMGQQYWIRVRGIRGNEYGQWSDPATRVANL